METPFVVAAFPGILVTFGVSVMVITLGFAITAVFILLDLRMLGYALERKNRRRDDKRCDQ